jgi:hypothetical protein
VARSLTGWLWAPYCALAVDAPTITAVRQNTGIAATVVRMDLLPRIVVSVDNGPGRSPEGLAGKGSSG